MIRIMYMYLFSIGLVALVYFGLVYPFVHWKKRGVPQQPIWQIWMQTVMLILQFRAVPNEVKSMYDIFSNRRYAGIYQFFLPTLLVRDPDLIKQITVKDFDHFVDHIEFVPKNSEPLWEKNVFALTGEKWRKMRTTLTPLYTGSKMKIMFGLMSQCAKQFVQYFEDKNVPLVEVEMKDASTRFANDVIATTAFGVTCDSLKNPENEFYLRGRQLTNFSNFFNNLRFLLLLIFPQVVKLFGITFFPKKVTKYFTKVMKENIKAREEKGLVRPDMIHLLLEANKGKTKHETEQNDSMNLNPHLKMTEEDIIAQAIIFFFAGFETVSTLMSFVSFELAVNPAIQDRLIKEVDNILNECSGEDSLTYEDLSKMKYLDMVISETLRKWPPGITLDRVCVKPYTIQPTTAEEQPVHIKTGDAVWIPVIGLHRDPKLYPEPEVFNPERFSDANKSKINPYAYIPFGTGPRNCIGNRFALTEVKVLFVHLLSRFRITTVSRTKVPLVIDKRKFQLSAEGGFWLGLKQRK